MYTISITEFKTSFNKYFKLALKEDILITKYGQSLYVLSKINSNPWRQFAEKWSNKKGYDVDKGDPKIAHMLGKL